MDYEEFYDDPQNYRLDNQGYTPDIIDSMKPAYYFNAKNRAAYGQDSISVQTP